MKVNIILRAIELLSVGSMFEQFNDWDKLANYYHQQKLSIFLTSLSYDLKLIEKLERYEAYCLTQVVKADPSNVQRWWDLGFIFAFSLSNNNTVTALQCFRKCAELAPLNEIYWLHIRSLVRSYYPCLQIEQSLTLIINLCQQIALKPNDELKLIMLVKLTENLGIKINYDHNMNLSNLIERAELNPESEYISSSESDAEDILDAIFTVSESDLHLIGYQNHVETINIHNQVSLRSQERERPRKSI